MSDLHGIRKGAAGVFRRGVELLQDILFLPDQDAPLHTEQQLCRGQGRFPGKSQDFPLRGRTLCLTQEPGDIFQTYLPFGVEQEHAGKPGEKTVLNGRDGQRSQKPVQGIHGAYSGREMDWPESAQFFSNRRSSSG